MFLVNFVNCFLLHFGVDMCVCVTDLRCALFKTLGTWSSDCFKCSNVTSIPWVVDFLDLFILIDFVGLSEKHWRLAGWIKDLADNFVVELDWFAATVNYVVRCHCAATCLRWLRGVILRKQAAAEEAGCPDWRVDKIHVRIEDWAAGCEEEVRPGQWRQWNNKFLKINFINFFTPGPDRRGLDRRGF